MLEYAIIGAGVINALIIGSSFYFIRKVPVKMNVTYEELIRRHIDSIPANHPLTSMRVPSPKKVYVHSDEALYNAEQAEAVRK